MEKHKKKSTKKLKFEKYNRYGYYFLIPFFIGFLLFQLYPIIYTFRIAFTSMNGWQTLSTATNVGFDNFVTLLTKTPLFIQSLQNTLLLWLLNFIPQILMALILAAWWTNRKLALKGSSFFKTVFYLPNMIMAASVAALFMILFSYPQGPANQFLMNLHLISHPFNFLQSVWGTRGITIFLQFWMWYGQTSIVFVAAISSIDESLFEAARIDGASDGQIYRRITMPLMRPIIMYTFVTSFVGGLQVFDIPYLLTQGSGGPLNSVYTLAIFIYNQAFQYRNYGIASAASIILLVIAAIVSIIMFRFFRERTTNTAIGGKK
ncbi:MAG: sugar ABC transporter permease [Streptococcaceae bacterium]|uniref:Sugar ABC transporter permease n=1 Tax=Lactococcus allomyrinae TaxID=2419773 RepID=A0A387BCF4_9LACT|nr:sugar ABC transporter permease [Lactococcus allomyrinae]AYG00138.1 sugar ABC transporter permease [Lactococcus allomyrinae]MCL2113556.1 sugar ABC transporter permease [Streptococcaceae bacterium]